MRLFHPTRIPPTLYRLCLLSLKNCFSRHTDGDGLPRQGGEVPFSRRRLRAGRTEAIYWLTMPTDDEIAPPFFFNYPLLFDVLSTTGRGWLVGGPSLSFFFSLITFLSRPSGGLLLATIYSQIYSLYVYGNGDFFFFFLFLIICFSCETFMGHFSSGSIRASTAALTLGTAVFGLDFGRGSDGRLS